MRMTKSQLAQAKKRGAKSLDAPKPAPPKEPPPEPKVPAEIGEATNAAVKAAMHSGLAVQEMKQIAASVNDALATRGRSAAEPVPVYRFLMKRDDRGMLTEILAVPASEKEISRFMLTQ